MLQANKTLPSLLDYTLQANFPPHMQTTIFLSYPWFLSCSELRLLFCLFELQYLPEVHKDPQDLRNRIFPKSITAKTKYNSDKIWQIIIWIQDAKPESIKAVDFSGAVLGSGSMWVLWHMTSNSDLFFITSSFILLAFSLLSLSTSADNYWRKKHIIKNPLLLNMKRKKKNNQVRMLSNLFNTLRWKNTRF